MIKHLANKCKDIDFKNLNQNKNEAIQKQI